MRVIINNDRISLVLWTIPLNKLQAAFGASAINILLFNQLLFKAGIFFTKPAARQADKTKYVDFLRQGSGFTHILLVRSTWSFVFKRPQWAVTGMRMMINTATQQVPRERPSSSWFLLAFHSSTSILHSAMHFFSLPDKGHSNPSRHLQTKEDRLFFFFFQTACQQTDLFVMQLFLSRNPAKHVMIFVKGEVCCCANRIAKDHQVKTQFSSALTLRWQILMVIFEL